MREGRNTEVFGNPRVFTRPHLEYYRIHFCEHLACFLTDVKIFNYFSNTIIIKIVVNEKTIIAEMVF